MARGALLAALVVALFPSAAVAQRCPAGTSPRQTHVRKGESLEAVARRVQAKAEDLRRLNRLRSDEVRPGQNLRYCMPVLRGSSIGSPNRGKLQKARSIDPDGDRQGTGFVLSPHRSATWGTPATVAAVRKAMACYRSRCPAGRKGECPPVNLGDLSAKDGGHLGNHLSHQSGRDVDLGYLVRPPQGRGVFDRQATAANLNVKAQWAVLGCLLDNPLVKFVFLSGTVAETLKAHARKVPALRKYLRFFQNGVIQPDTEHLTHLHVRYRCPKTEPHCQD
jgi:murein endopeptidase